MIVVTILLVLLIGFMAYIYYRPVQTVIVERRPPVLLTEPDWIPWSYGAGGWGWPGSFYLSRPVPHFYKSTPHTPSRPRPGGDATMHRGHASHAPR